tara:strand:- start:694 stop:981 length:288 start_codon:yes stop_codon:yes gene_type:complete
MSEKEKRFEMKEGKFNLLKTPPEQLEENPSRPAMFGTLKIPKGAKEGDVLKLSAWRQTSQKGSAYLGGNAELPPNPTDDPKEKAEITNTDVDFLS